MTALAADTTLIPSKLVPFNIALPMQANQRVWKGSAIVMGSGLAGTNLAGHARALAAGLGGDEGHHAFAGFALERIDNRTGLTANGEWIGDGTAGNVSVKLQAGGTKEIVTTGATDEWIGRPAYMTDDQTGSITKAIGAWRVGVVTKFISATRIEIEVQTFINAKDWDAARRFTLKETFTHKPKLNADVEPTTVDPTAAQLATLFEANKDFEVTGTNAVEGSVTFADGGGILLTTAGADNDQVAIFPHQDVETAWDDIVFSPEDQVSLIMKFRAGSATLNEVIAGLKLTAAIDHTTDADQLLIKYDEDDKAVGVEGPNWRVIDSIGGSGVNTDSGVVPVTTELELRIITLSTRVALIFINGVLVRTTAALTAGAVLKPYLSVQAKGIVAATATLHSIELSKLVA